MAYVVGLRVEDGDEQAMPFPLPFLLACWFVRFMNAWGNGRLVYYIAVGKKRKEAGE